MMIGWEPAKRLDPAAYDFSVGDRPITCALTELFQRLAYPDGRDGQSFLVSACVGLGDALCSTSSFHRRLWILYVLFGFPAMWSGFGYWFRHLDAISRLQFPRERFGDKLTPRMKLVDIKFDYPPSRICFFYKNNIRLSSRNPLPRLLAPSRCHPPCLPQTCRPS